MWNKRDFDDQTQPEEMGFVSDQRRSEIVCLLLFITATAMAQPLHHPSGLTPSDIQTANTRGVEGKCHLKDIVTVFVEIDGNGCNSSNNIADNSHYYLIVVQNRCKYCNAKGVSVEVSGYFLGDEIVNLKRSIAPGGDQYVLKYSNSNEVGGVSPARATFYECRDS